MRKNILLFFVLLFCLCACMPQDANIAPSPNAAQNEKRASPPDAGAPAPVQQKLLLLMDDENHRFFEGVQEAAQSLHWVLEETYITDIESMDADTLSSYQAFIVFCATENIDLHLLLNRYKALPIAIVDSYENRAITDCIYTYIDFHSAAEDMLNAAIAYPPHDTPVRMLALLNKKNSPAHKVYAQAITEGRALSRDAYYGEDIEKAIRFLEAQLKKYVEGMVDAIYMENTALLAPALNMLLAHDRTDMEVFCVPQGDLYFQQQYYTRYLFPVAAGIDYYALGRTQVHRIEQALQYPQSAFKPTIVQPMIIEKSDW